MRVKGECHCQYCMDTHTLQIKREMFGDLCKFFLSAYDYCVINHADELIYVDEKHFSDQTAWRLFCSYVYVVLNSGMKNVIAERIFQKYIATVAAVNGDEGFLVGDLSIIGHPQKRKAIQTAQGNYVEWFEALQKAPDKLACLDSLPFIGPITKYHLARNLGLDYAKPDRHLQRLSDKYWYPNVQKMCEALAAEFGMRVGTVDLIIWRYMSSLVRKLQQQSKTLDLFVVG